MLTKQLTKYEVNEIPFVQISLEAKINYEGLEKISYAKQVQTDFNSVDTITVFNAKWHDSVPNTYKQQKQLNLWLKQRLKLDTLQLNNY